MATALSPIDALAGVREALLQILTDRGTPSDPEAVTPASALYEHSEGVQSLGLDSLDALDLITMLEERFEVQLPDDVDFEAIKTVGDVVDALVAAARP